MRITTHRADQSSSYARRYWTVQTRRGYFTQRNPFRALWEAIKAS